MAIYEGLDLGSTTGKVVLIDENRKILGWSIVPSLGGPDKTAEHAKEVACKNAGLSPDIKPDYLIATGYGRNAFQKRMRKSLKFPAMHWVHISLLSRSERLSTLEGRIARLLL